MYLANTDLGTFFHSLVWYNVFFFGTFVVPPPLLKYRANLLKLSTDKRSSLFAWSVSGEENQFYDVDFRSATTTTCAPPATNPALPPPTTPAPILCNAY